MLLDRVLATLLVATAVTTCAIVGGSMAHPRPAYDAAAVSAERMPAVERWRLTVERHVPPALPVPVERQRRKVVRVPKRPSEETVRLAQANIKQGTTTFAADLATVAAVRPDFITLNEAGYRTDAQIRPAGYDAYRAQGSPYLRETPVLWRTDRWSPIGTGSRWMTTRKVRWGERAVNWATLRSSTTGNVVSVVSAHPAPTTKATQGLLQVFAQRLGLLVDELSERGPVLVGGDLNAHYGGRSYPGAVLARSGLTPTYATFGAPSGGTGDHFGATIDYLLHTSGLTPEAQSTVELHSDHDAVLGTFTLTDD